MNYDAFVAFRTDAHRAASLARENELRRARAERGEDSSAHRPAVKTPRALTAAWRAVFGRTSHNHRRVAQL